MNKPFVLILIGLLSISFGYNLIQHHRISHLEDCLCESNMWLNAIEFSQMKDEIKRLDLETQSVLKK